MQKIVLLLLCAALTLACAPAFAEVVPLAENTDRFDITIALPEGATLSSNWIYETSTIATVEKDGLAGVVIAIAPSEIYDEQSLGDLRDEEINALKEQTCEDYDNPTSEVSVTPSGNKYILVRQDGELAMATVFTLYRGYFVQLTQINGDFAPLTDADTEFLMDNLYGIEFEEVAQ